MLFGEYNMLAVVSQGELDGIPQEAREHALDKSLSGMLALALLGVRATADEMQFHAEGRQKTIQAQATELDSLRVAAQERLDVIQAQGAELEMLRTAAQERLELIQKLDEALKNATRK